MEFSEKQFGHFMRICSNTNRDEEFSLPSPFWLGKFYVTLIKP